MSIFARIAPRTTAPVLLGLVVAAGAVGAPGTAAQEERSQQEIVLEMQQIQQQLAPIEQEAMQDRELQQTRDDLNQQVVDKIQEMDPEAESKLERIQKLQQELGVAQEEGDAERSRELVGEMQEIQGQLQTLQAQALQDEQIAAEYVAFRDQVRERMVEIDPAAAELVERLDALQQELQPGAGV